MLVASSPAYFAVISGERPAFCADSESRTPTWTTFCKRSSSLLGGVGTRCVTTLRLSLGSSESRDGRPVPIVGAGSAANGAWSLRHPKRTCARTGPRLRNRRMRARQAVAQIEEFLDGLDDIHREVFVLAVVEGFRAGEIAEMTECNVNTVYSRIRKARTLFSKFAKRRRSGVPMTPRTHRRPQHQRRGPCSSSFAGRRRLTRLVRRALAASLESVLTYGRHPPRQARPPRVEAIGLLKIVGV